MGELVNYKIPFANPSFVEKCELCTAEVTEGPGFAPGSIYTIERTMPAIDAAGAYLEELLVNIKGKADSSDVVFCVSVFLRIEER